MIVLSRDITTAMSNAIMLAEYTKKKCHSTFVSQIPLNDNYTAELQNFD